MNLVNNSEEILQDISNIFKNINVIDLDKLRVEDISLINRNIDDYNTFFTTQQATFIDYSKFDNHVFFDSAVNKVSYSFNKILNFPYDVDEFNYKQYINKLEGYTNYIYKENYPKNISYISLDGNKKILVKNKTSSIDSDNIEEKIGILCPKDRFSFNFWLKINANGFVNNQVVFKFFNSNNNSGFICFISLDNSKYYLNFLIINNSNFTTSKTEIILDVFQNITINVTNKTNNNREINFLVDGNKVEKIDSPFMLESNNFHESLEEIQTSFIIGCSELLSLNINGVQHDFENLNGSIDEFRFYHKIKSIKETKREIHKNIFSQRGLVLYLKFNEPGGDYTNSYVCIDSSGNKLHGFFLDNEDNIIQDTTSYKISNNTPLKLEDINLSPIVNSNFPEIESLRSNLISIAGKYDDKNPNLIFKLMPKHYFLEASDQQKLQIFSNTNSISSNYAIGAEQEANTHFVNIVLIWARFFDQLKIYIDSISTLVDIDYDIINEKKILGIKIPLLCKLYGLDFKEIFSSITKRKQNKEALRFEDIINDISIRKIQNEIWYKILINSQSILKAKGTINGINELLSTVGINYSNNIAIREYSLNNDLTRKENIFEESRIKHLGLNFLNPYLLNTPSTFENQSGFSNEKPYIEILNLKNYSSINQNNNDFILEESQVLEGLGENFSIELFFKLNNFLDNNENIKDTQNILRIDHIKSPVVNIYCTRKNKNSNLFNIVANIKPVINSHMFNVSLIIENIDLFSRENYICLTQSINDNIITFSLNARKANSNLIVDKVKNASKSINIENIQSSDITSNQDKLNLRIGHYYYDNFTKQLFTIDETDFQGEILNIKTWNKELSYNEIENHSKNILNVSENNIKNTNLINNFFVNREIYDSDIISDGSISYFLVNNNCILRKKEDSLIKSVNDCKFCIKSSQDLKSLVFYNEFIVQNKTFSLDNFSNLNRTKIVSFKEDENKITTNNFNQFPSNSLPYDYQEELENRLSIDFSTSKMLNDDISKLIVNIDEFNETLYSNNIYNYNYSNIEKLKSDYFDRLSDENFINYSSLANVFRYLDNILSSILQEMIPSKVKFQGFNLVYESHILERHKYQHRNSDSRLNIYNNNESFNFSRKPIKSYRDSSYNSNRSMLDNVID